MIIPTQPSEQGLLIAVYRVRWKCSLFLLYFLKLGTIVTVIMAQEYLPSVAIQGAIAGSAALMYAWSRSSSKSKLPPGPVRLPLIGSALQMPMQSPWLTFSEWRKKYGA